MIEVYSGYTIPGRAAVNSRKKSRVRLKEKVEDIPRGEMGLKGRWGSGPGGAVPGSGLCPMPYYQHQNYCRGITGDCFAYETLDGGPDCAGIW